MFPVLLGIYLGVDLLGRMVTVCLTFSGTSKLSSKRLHHFTFPPAVDEGSILTISSPLVIVCLLDFGHSNGCEVDKILL